jgi:hypothetical protein
MGIDMVARIPTLWNDRTIILLNNIVSDKGGAGGVAVYVKPVLRCIMMATMAEIV